MKNIKFIFAIILSFLCLGADTAGWNITKSTHFIVYSKKAKSDFVSQVVNKAEDYYESIADELGFRRFNFWLWDNRAKIYIYDDAKDYQASTGQPEWSGGSANVKDKVIQTFPYAKDFLESTLPHEMGHIIYRELIGYDNPASPIWLDEGVACFQEKARLSYARRVVLNAIEQEKFINLIKLSQINPQLLKDPEQVAIFYSESITVVDFLIRQFGSSSFVNFCQQLRDTRNFEAALRSAYGFKSLGELDKAWQGYLIQ